MSLHAQLSPEAQARLEAQKRNSTISSIAISILTIILLGLTLGLVLLKVQTKEVPVLVTYEVPKEDEVIEEVRPKPQVDKRPSSPSSSTAKVIASTAPSAVSVPVPDVVEAPLSLDFGDGNDFGNGWGQGDGIGSGGFAGLPAAVSKRCNAADRASRLKETGGTAECDKAVVKALDYFKATQNEDGSWGKEHQAAMTGFALLAYLGHCETPKSKNYGASVTKAINYLTNVAEKNDGRISVHPEGAMQWVYEHGICTYALAESLTFVQELKITNDFPKLKDVTKKAGEMIMDGQSPAGGWNYRYGKAPTGDNSVGFWQIQALKALKHTKIWPDTKLKKHADEALKFLTKVQGQDGAIGYREDSNRSPGLTGGGVLAFQMWDEGDSKPAERGIEWIRKNTESFDIAKSNLYYNYYHAQAMINAGGENWKHYNGVFRDNLLKAQQSDGSWKQKMSHGPINDHMATALAAMMLEVYYRFLPSSVGHKSGGGGLGGGGFPSRLGPH